MAADAEISESEVRQSSLKRQKMEGDDDGGKRRGPVPFSDSDSDDDDTDPKTNFSDSDSDYDEADPEKVQMKKEHNIYLEQYTSTEGFGVTVHSRMPYIGLTHPVELFREDCPFIPYVKDCTDFAIQEKNPKLKLVKILNATFRGCAGYMFKITFEAEDSTSGDKNIYQTQVYDRISENKKELVLFRLKPKDHDY